MISIPNNNSFFVFGARGTGKTTLLKEKFAEKSLYIDLLQDEVLERYLLNPSLLKSEIEALKSPPEWVVLDEVQKAPKLLNVVHQMIESPLKQKFVLTGSSARRLKQKGVNLLAGRAWLRNIHPLTFLELRNSFELSQVINWGTLPTLLSLDSKQDKNDYLRAYASTYLKTEIQEEQWVRQIEPFRKFLPIAAQMNGKVLNFSAIAREVGVQVPTIQSYYEILEDTLIGFFLPAFHKSIRKQQKMAPKFLFFDLGVKKALNKLIGVELSPRTSEWGFAFEHFIILEAIRFNDYFQKDFTFSYFLTKDLFEVDLVIERPGQKDLFVEIKSSNKVFEKDFSKFESFVQEQKSDGIVLSEDPLDRKQNGVWYLHWEKGLKEIFGK